MMPYFCEVNTMLQIVLLVLSLLAGMILTAACALSFRHRHHVWHQVTMAVVLLANAILYVMMQIDSRLTGAEHSLHLPYIIVFVATVASLGFAVQTVLRETQHRKAINHTSIKESFDNLPTGVCFFNEEGLLVLCNRAMHRFSFAVCGKDVQHITDLQDCLSDQFVPVADAQKDGKVFMLADGRAWHLEAHKVTDVEHGAYMQFIAVDITDLYRSHVELTEENAQLRRVQADLKRLSANVVAITREEEILNTKMRVHDEMGRCLVEAGKYLREGSGDIPENVVHSWKRAVSMLKYNNEISDDDMLVQILKTCESLKLQFIQTGVLPQEEHVAYILTCAVRECVTNAVRYADASELYVTFAEDDTFATVAVSNNGKPPESEVVEGGGLSTLRRRVERAGGVMTVQSSPQFQLTVTVPKRKEACYD